MAIHTDHGHFSGYRFIYCHCRGYRLSLPEHIMPLAFVVVGHPAQILLEQARFSEGKIRYNGWQQRTGREAYMKRVIYGLIGVAWIVGLLSNFFVADAAEDGSQLFQRACLGCHGADGTSTAMGIPAALKGQSSDDLHKKLTGYKNGTFGLDRKNVMGNVVKSYSDEQIRALSDSTSKL